MRNILVIGGSGFIGANIIETLASDNYNVIVLTRGKNYIQPQEIPKIKVVQGRLSDSSLIMRIVLDYCIETILHLASNLVASSTKSQFDSEMQDIVLPTFELLNLISERNLKIIFFSSGGAIYGKSNEPINETSKLEPINYYGYSKLLIESHIKFLSRVAGLRYVILRPSNVYGRYQRTESDHGFIAVALGKMLHNQVIEIWGDGTTVRDYVDVSEVASAVRSIIKEDVDKEIFNIGSGEGHSLSRVVHLLEKHLNQIATVTYKEKRRVDADKVILDISKLQACIDYKPKILEFGIKDLISYHLLAKSR